MHGYENPWPAGGGKNKFQTTNKSKTEFGVTWTVNADGTITLSGTATDYTSMYPGRANVNSSMGIVTISGLGDTTNIIWAGVSLRDSNDNALLSIAGGSAQATFTVDLSNYPTAAYITLGFKRSNNAAVSGTLKPQVEIGSSATSFAPYENLCPISGHTGAEIYHEAEYDADADPAISVTFPSAAGTVYGATMTLNPDRTGTLVVDRAIKALLSSDTFSFSRFSSRNRIAWDGYESVGKIAGHFVSDRLTAKGPSSGGNGVNEWEVWGSTVASRCWISVPLSITTVNDFKNWLSENPVHIVYELATPITYQLTAEQVSGILTTLYGTNNIWCDTGDVTVTYIAKSAKFSFGSPLHNYNYNNLKLFGNTYIEHGKG